MEDLRRDPNWARHTTTEVGYCSLGFSYAAPSDIPRTTCARSYRVKIEVHQYLAILEHRDKSILVVEFVPLHVLHRMEFAWIRLNKQETSMLRVLPGIGDWVLVNGLPWGYGAFESPDGKFLYYTKYPAVPGIWRRPTSGGEETQVLGGLEPEFGAIGPSSKRVSIISIPLQNQRLPFLTSPAVKQLVCSSSRPALPAKSRAWHHRPMVELSSIHSWML